MRRKKRCNGKVARRKTGGKERRGGKLVSRDGKEERKRCNGEMASVPIS